MSSWRRTSGQVYKFILTSLRENFWDQLFSQCASIFPRTLEKSVFVIPYDTILVPEPALFVIMDKNNPR